MGFQPILNLIRSPGSWSQWTSKLRPGSDYSASTSASQSLSRRSSTSELSELSQSSGDTWNASVISSKESFGTPLLPEAFNALDQGIIRQEMTRCQYGLGWQWLHPKNKIRLQLTSDEQLQFSGYHASPKADPFVPPQGDCQQLALQLGQRLHRRFQGKYKFYVVAGNYPQSPWRVHYFLMGWPAREDAYFLDKTRGALHPFTKQPTARIPKEAFLIDPTYQIMGFAAKHDRLGQYIAVHPQFQEIGQYRIPSKPKTQFNFGKSDQLSPGLPLGFAKDLQPGHADPEAVAFAYFKRTPASIDSSKQAQKVHQDFEPSGAKGPPTRPANVQVHLGWGDQPDLASHWRQTVPAHTPLYQMLSRLEAAAAKAKSNDIAASMGCLPWYPLGDSQRLKLKPSRT